MQRTGSLAPSSIRPPITVLGVQGALLQYCTDTSIPFVRCDLCEHIHILLHHELQTEVGPSAAPCRCFSPSLYLA